MQPDSPNPPTRSVLMVAYHFPPLAGSSGIQRSLSFVRHLPGLGWRPIVLGIREGAFRVRSDSQLGDIHPQAIVHRSLGFDTSRELAIGGRYPRSLALPDRWASWYPFAVRAGLALIRRHRPRAIWSTYPIATAHRIGATLARLSGLPFVADFRDSMTEPDYPPDPDVWRSFRAVEARVAARATKLCFTAPSAVTMYRERYPDLPAEKFVLLENGFDELQFEEATPAPRAAGAPFTFLHAGIVYASERDPTQLFDALAALRERGVIDATKVRVVLRAAGPREQFEPDLARRGIEDIVRLKPPIPYREALAEMLGADALLLLQASNCNHQIPAKLYEYVRAGRPVFALTDPAGDTAATLRKAGIDSITPLDDAAAIADALPRFVEAARAGRAPLPGPDSVAAASRAGRTRHLAELLDEVTRPLPQE